jgi:hypothetical protein
VEYKRIEMSVGISRGCVNVELEQRFVITLVARIVKTTNRMQASGFEHGNEVLKP